MTTAVEMPFLWKPHTGFHRNLEISHRPRDFHIPTAVLLVSQRKNNNPETDHKVLPMYPV